MKMRRLAAVSLLALLSLPGMASALDEPDTPYEGRTLGYPDGKKTNLEDSGTLGAYFLLIPLSLLTIGVMCKNANRSHLD